MLRSTSKTRGPLTLISTPTHEACAGDPGSAAEENAASCTGIRDDEAIIFSRKFPESAWSDKHPRGSSLRRRSALRNSDSARNDRVKDDRSGNDPQEWNALSIRSFLGQLKLCPSN